MIKPDTLQRWTVDNSAELYGIRNWGAGFFDISPQGEIIVYPHGRNQGPSVSLVEIAAGLKDRGLGMPVLLRFADILASRLRCLNESFEKAIRDAGYKAVYRGVYPVKVNQQQHVIEEIVACGKPYHHGLEAGSKAELIAALTYMDDPDSLIVCNGYKDEEFVDLALYGLKMGMPTVLVIEMPDELPMIVERAARMKVRPRLGIRCKLSTRASGHWNDSGGDRSVFGLTATQIIDVVDTLRQHGMLDCLQMLHYHLGSQIPNIRNIQSGILEASRIYVSLVNEGAAMGYLNVGGGLAVDYDGSHTNFASSSNYSIDEYAADIVEVIQRVANESGVAHPVIVSESGRALVAHHSVLLFNVLGVTQVTLPKEPEPLPENANQTLRSLWDTNRVLNGRNLQECYHDAVYYRDEVKALFEHGMIALRERALADRMFWHIICRIARECQDQKYIPDELEGIDKALADVYHSNFSVFQSLPDAWAIDQLFPVLPVHRLQDCPMRQGTIADITCDCDGKLDRFVDLKDVSPTVRLHEFKGGDYLLGVFLVGAYQETLGDLHNLFGDTHVVNIRLGESGHVEYDKEITGDTVADVLTYVEYDTAEMIETMRAKAEVAVRRNLITAQERREIMDAYETGLRGYTYFEQ